MDKKLAEKNLTKAIKNFQMAEQKYIEKQVAGKKLTDPLKNKQYKKALDDFKNAQLDHLYSEDK